MTSRLRSALGLAAAILAAPSLAAAGAPAPTYALQAPIRAPDGGYDYASFDPVHRRLYVSRAGGVTAVEVDTGAVTGQLIAAGRTHESLPLDHGAALLVTDSTSNTAHLVDALTGASLAEIPTGLKPDAALFDPASGLAIAVDGKAGELTLIDPVARKAVGAITVGGGLEFAVADGQGRVFVNIEDQNRIAVIDTSTRAVVARYDLAGCEGPTGLAYAKSAGVLISACANHLAKVIRASDGKELASLAIGAGPDAVIYDAERELAFIPCGRDGVLEVVAVPASGAAHIVQSLATQVGARTGALDPRTGRLYLPTASFVASPAGGRPVAQPGTFQILVVAPSQ